MCPQSPYLEATENVARAMLGLPDLDGGSEYAGVELYEVEGALVALGRVPFPQMMRAVLEHTGAPAAYDREDFEQRHRMLRHLTYRTVAIEQSKNGKLEVDWDHGLTPITAYRPMT